MADFEVQVEEQKKRLGMLQQVMENVRLVGALEAQGAEKEKKIEMMMKAMRTVHFMSGPVYKDANLVKALMKMRKNEVEGVYHLTEMHCPSFRFRATAVYDRTYDDPSASTMPMVRDHFTFRCHTKSLQEHVNEMLDKVEEMPKEWTIVQLTPVYHMKEKLQLTNEKWFSNPIYISVFNCGQNKEKPVNICIDIPRDDSGNPIELMQHFKELIKTHLNQELNGTSYAAFRLEMNNKMKDFIQMLQLRWLKEWRVLLMGKFVDQEIEHKLDEQLIEILKSAGMYEKMSPREMVLLRYIIKGCHYLTPQGFNDAVCLAFNDYKGVSEKLLRPLIKSLKEVFLCQSLEKAKRYPVILVVEESLDCLPWESIDVLDNQPVCRMPSLHFTYAMYKEHEHEIVDGYKLVKYNKKGVCLINPDNDLPRMQKRMQPFFEYWLPEWEKIVARTPTSPELCKLIMNTPIYSYSGHGDGFQYIRGEQIQRLRVNAVVLLFGCNSVKLKDISPQCEPYGRYQNYITACSPCIVGTNWSVTDLDIDLVSTTFKSIWIPSEAPTHWSNFEKKQWESGQEDIKIGNLPKTKVNHIVHHEPDLLRALCKAKMSARQYLTQAACIARGIPVKLISN